MDVPLRLFAIALFIGAATVPHSAFAADAGRFAVVSPPRLPPLGPAAGISAAPAPIRYKIADDGAPNPKVLTLGVPIGLSNTRQIVGIGSFVGNGNPQCVAWTGAHYVAFGGPRSLACYPTVGISSANAAGDFHTVGETNVPTTNQLVAFYADLTKTAVSMRIFSSNSPSALYTMNAAGLAAGYSYYAPFGGFEYSEPTFVSNGTAFVPFQPTCLTASSTCLTQAYYATSYYGLTRSINAAGTVLGQQSIPVQYSYAEHNATNPHLDFSFTLPFQGANPPGQPIGIDDLGRLYYTGTNAASTETLAFRFDPRTNAAVSLGNFKGDTCSFSLHGLNGPGEALVYASSCKVTADNGWATWDQAHGFSHLSATPSGGGYPVITPEWLNDNGDILVQLETNSAVVHWGIFARQ